jgi:hypothetical protein
MWPQLLGDRHRLPLLKCVVIAGVRCVTAVHVVATAAACKLCHRTAAQKFEELARCEPCALCNSCGIAFITLIVICIVLEICRQSSLAIQKF